MESLSKQLAGDVTRLQRGEDNIKKMSNIQPLVDEFVNGNANLPDMKEKIDALQKSLADTTNEYATISDETKEVKEELSSRGQSMSDTKALVDIKKTIKNVDGEIAEMDVRLGVLMHSLWGSRKFDEDKDGLAGGIDEDDEVGEESG